LVQDWVPLCAEAFADYRLGGVSLSRMGVDALRARLRGEDVAPEAFGLSAREWAELCAVFGPGLTGGPSGG